MKLEVKQQTASCGSAELGSLVFSVLNIIVASIASVLSLGFFVYWLLYVATVASHEPHSNPNAPIGYMFMYIQFAAVTFVMGCSFVSFTFGVLLIHGLVKKRPNLMKAYYVYGCVVNILSVIGIFGYLGVSEFGDPLTAAVALIGCFFYSLILAMIHNTYKKFETSFKQFNHQPL